MAQVETKESRSNGIKKWLCTKEYCLVNGKIDETQYRTLIAEFIVTVKPNFDKSKMANGFSSMENFVSNRFPDFCHFANRKYNPR